MFSSLRTIRLLGLLLVFSTLVPSQALPAPRAKCIADVTRQIIKPKLDSAVEMEIQMSPRVLPLITTLDGTLQPMLVEGKEIPAEILNLIHSQKGARFDPGKFLWDDLDGEQQHALMKAMCKGASFFDNRSIPGMMMRKKVRVHFVSDTTLFGNSYKKGFNEVDTSDFLVPKVEHLGPTSVDEVAGFEFHFRTNLPSGQVWSDARKFIYAAVGPSAKIGTHIHIVSKMPDKLFEEASSKIAAKVITDYYRRANLLAEVLSSYAGSPVRTVESDGATYFDNLSANSLSSLEVIWAGYSKKRGLPKFGDQYKMAYIGLRGPDSYDQAAIWGLEYRAVPHRPNTKVMSAILDAIQYDMQRSQFTIGPDEIKQWIKDQPDLDGAPHSLLYDMDLDQMLSNASADVAAAARALGTRLEKLSGENKLVKALLTDWSKDTIFMKHTAEELQAVREAQIKALKALKKRDADVERVLADFFTNSGVLRAIARSLSVEHLVPQMERITP
jgi:hypothetical protein